MSIKTSATAPQRTIGFSTDYHLVFIGLSPSSLHPSDFAWTPEPSNIDPVYANTWTTSDTADLESFAGESAEAARVDERKNFAAGLLAGFGSGAIVAALQKLIEKSPLGRKRNSSAPTPG